MDPRRRFGRPATAVGCSVVSLVICLGGATGASATTMAWNTPGVYQWVVPPGITSATFNLYGASGAPAGGSKGGNGGRTAATIAVTPGETLNVNVGCAPAAGLTPCGYGGGGGIGHPVCAAGGAACYGGFGGGASDVRQGGTDLANRVLIAGGGGGAGGPSSDYCSTVDNCQTSVGGGDGGNGGPLTGQRASDGANYVVLNPPPGQLPGGGCGGGGGTQSAGGSSAGDGNTTCNGPTGNTSGGTQGFGGQGGDSALGGGAGGGGGGGYFGGGGGSGGGSTSSGNPMGGNNGGGGGGGGGGSSFAEPAATQVTIEGGKNLGDGSVIVTYGAAPVKHTLTVTRAGTGKGSVKSSPAGIACGATCSASFTHGTSVTLTATRAPGSMFAGWSGACSGTGKTCTLTMSANKAVTAKFKPIPPPNTAITAAKISSAKRTATLSFKGIGGVGGRHFKCKLDGASFVACSSPKTYAGLTKGAHTFKVKAIDSRGRADPTPAVRTFHI